MSVRIETLAELKSIRFDKNETVFCVQNGREYYLELDGGSFTPDDIDFVQAIHGRNAMYIAISGSTAGQSSTIASQAEAEAGTENTKAMSALRTAQAIAAQVVSPVSSVHGRTGAVTAQAGDYAAYYEAVKTYITSQATPSRVTGSAPTALGQYRSYLRNASARTYTETNGSPTTAPSSSNGYKIYNGNEFASADTNNEPSKYQIYIGTGKNPIFEFYASTGRTGAVFVGATISGGPSLAGTMFRYDPTTGIVDVYVPASHGYHQCPGVDEFGTNLDADIYFDIKC